MKILVLLYPLTFLLHFVTPNPDAGAEPEAEWNGKWFPRNPYDNEDLDCTTICDNGFNCIEKDFDHEKQKYLWTCEDNRTLYESNFSIRPEYTEYEIPKAYVPQSLCMNESIEYGNTLVTYGDYRPVWAKYGEYTYLPVQRWMHNLELGAIVALYHPCANKMQISVLKATVSNCMFRHIITSSKTLSKEKPFALLAWGRSLEMSVADTFIIRSFIKEEALKTTKNVYDDGVYERLLDRPASLVSDEKDSELCPND